MLLSIYACLLSFTFYSSEEPLVMQLYSNSNTSYILINDNSFDIVLGYDLYIDTIDTEFDLPSLTINCPYSITTLNDIELNFLDIYVENGWLNFDYDVLVSLSNGETFFSTLDVDFNLYDDLVVDDLYLDYSFSIKLINVELDNFFYDLGYKNGLVEGQGVNNVISWFGSIWDGLAKIFSLEIAPNLTIGTIITIPIVIAVLFFGLKALIQ